MKRNIPSFLSGFLTCALVVGLAGGALAISSKMTIEVDPINIQVNGEIFQPKDEHGNEVPVFAYGGTTYAPLRALAKAYGLEVGYNKETNMATVVDPEVGPAVTTPDTTAKTDYAFDYSYEEFNGLWDAMQANDQTWFFISKDDQKVSSWLNSAPNGLAEEYEKSLILEHPEAICGDFLKSGGDILVRQVLHEHP